MGQRLDLHTILVGITDHVYFQPPENIAMQFPCIVYRRNNIDTIFAENSPYHLTNQYMVTVIDRDPDTGIVAQVAALPQCKYQRHYAVDNFNHDVLLLYF